MKSEFTEFSYGYAVTENIVRSSKGLSSAPIFPSLYQEGQTGGGYDVKISRATPLFLQFKLSDFFSNRRAKQYDHFNSPYFRFNIMPDNVSQQHQLLIDLESSGEEVFYIAPEFYRMKEFNQYYLSDSIIQNSAAFSPLEIGEIYDHSKHVVCYRGRDNSGLFFSEPKKITKHKLGNQLDSIRRKKKERTIDEGYFEGLKNKLLDSIEHTDKVVRQKERWYSEIDSTKKMPFTYGKTFNEEILQTLKNASPEKSVDVITKVVLGVQLVFLNEDEN